MIALLAALGYVIVGDPHTIGTPVPRCPIKLVTGLDCPACGGLRMVHDLIRGRFGLALVDNPFLAVVSPILAYLLYRHYRAVRIGAPLQVPRNVAYGLLIAASIWGIVRNLPSWPWKPTLSQPGGFLERRPAPIGRRAAAIS